MIPQRRLVHRRRAAAPVSARARLAAAVELRVGDYVVHEDHGVARFSGFDTKTLAGVTRDYLELEYRGGDRVFAPTDQLARISRYVGADGDEPALSPLGGKRWQNMKSRARRAAQAMAGELINLYAERQVRKGHAFSPDGEMQMAFEAAFPYRETADQMDAIDAVKADMESERPMDRLICGDVGYGKTEIALRAAHKAAADGKQVMMLVPTTILAQQHFGTFRERFADTPFNVEMVSRLRKPAEIKQVLERFGEGKVDVLIGTHRLLSRDVRGKDLGLMIVDEEQRFGVKQKELLRQLKLKVDVLSLSATPIPRTLQMSLAGLRDISVIETPPEGRRPVRTHVGPYDEDLVKRAIIREKERGGQVFFLHNRIDTLHETAERLRALCPGVRFAEAHGQMDELQLEATMLAFVRGEHDVLVATTIIESGLDIPTANTLLVERADQLGLAQAYQIRGRVGRSRERAFAYLLYPSAESLTPDAAARLATLSDNTELGSGFRVAMRDLEIRGAGNLLGDEQSGHVAAVGFELYCQMLEDAAEAAARRRGRAARGAAGAGADRRRRRRLRPLGLHPLRGGEDRRAPPRRRRPGARASCGRCARSSRTASGRCPTRSPTCSTSSGSGSRSARPGRAASSSAPAACGSSRSSSTPSGSPSLNERVPEAIYQWRERTIAVPVPDDPTARLGALIAVAEGLSAALVARTPRRGQPLSTHLGVCGYAAAPVNRGFFSKRNMAILFGATLVLMVVIVAVAVGVGHPNVPSDDVAVIDDASIDVPGLFQDGHISKTNFDRFLLQTAKQNQPPAGPAAQRPAVPAAQGPGDAERPPDRLDRRRGQQGGTRLHGHAGPAVAAADQVPVQERAGVREGARPGGADRGGRGPAGQAPADPEKIQENVSNSVGSASNSDVQDYYDANKAQFTQPAKRTIRIIQNKDANQVNQALQAPPGRFVRGELEEGRRPVLDRSDLEGQGRPAHGRRAGLLPAAARRRRSSTPPPARSRAR